MMLNYSFNRLDIHRFNPALTSPNVTKLDKRANNPVDLNPELVKK